MGNELKLSLENFQSISKGELIFHTGTNVIIGQSNSGKSATFRALKACLINPIGSQRFIKKGTNQASVMLEYNGNQIIWKRTPKENSYIINGETYLKTGRSNAFKLVDDTGFAIDSNDVIMNIEEELQLPFPFGISDVDLFKLYENVFCISDSAVILKAAKGVEDKTKLEITTIENDIVKSENKLKELLDFKNSVDMNKLKKLKGTLESKNERLMTLKDGLPIIKRACRVQEFSVEDKTFINLLGSYTENKKLKKTIEQLKKLHAINKTLKELKQPKESFIGKYEELKKLKKTCSVLRELENVSVQVKSFENKLNEYKELKSFSEEIERIKKNIKSKKQTLENLKEKALEAEEALKEFKVCPLCHKPL